MIYQIINQGQEISDTDYQAMLHARSDINRFVARYREARDAYDAFLDEAGTAYYSEQISMYDDINTDLIVASLHALCIAHGADDVQSCVRWIRSKYCI